MGILSTYEGTRRGRRRRAARRAALWLALAAVVGLAAAALGYRLGGSQGRAAAARLEADLARLQERDRAAGDRVARAEQQAEAAIARAAQLQARLDAELPRGALADLVARLADRLRGGVPADRIAFLLDRAAVERRCVGQLETRRVAVRTPRATGPSGSAAFADGRVLVSAEGAAPPAASAGPATGGEPGFDPARPVTLRFLAIDGEAGALKGLLPLTHALAQGQEEFLFAVRAVADRPGEIEITSQRCPLP